MMSIYAKNYLILSLEIILLNPYFQVTYYFYQSRVFLMKKYLTTAVLLSTSLLAATHAHDDRQQDIPTFKLRKLPQDTKNIVFGMMPAKDLQNLRVSCRQMKDTVDLHYQPYVLPRLIERASSAPSHQAVADDIAIIKLGRTKAQTEAAIHNAIATHLNANSFICVEMGCPLSPYLLMHPDLKQADISVFKDYPGVFSQMQQMYAQIFKELMPVEEKMQRFAYNMFADVYQIKKVYFSKKELEKNIFSFLETLKSHIPLQETYRTLLTDTPIDHTSHIVISDAQIHDLQLKTKLQNLLAANSDHTVVLTVGNSEDIVDERGKLNNEIVNNFVRETKIKFLQLVNPRGNVKVIEDGFLITCDIVRFNIQGFKSLQSIGNMFIITPLLTDVSFKDLPSLIWIGSHFMANCFDLVTCDFQGLPNVQHIGPAFLKNFRECSESKDLIIRRIQQINAKQKVGLADVQLTSKK